MPQISMDMKLMHAVFTAAVDGDDTEDGIKVRRDKSDDKFLRFKTGFFIGYILFEVDMFSGGEIDVGEPETKKFCKCERQLVYIERRFLKACDDGVWFIPDKSLKYIHNSLMNAKPRQIRLIID